MTNIHPTALVSSDAKIGKNVTIGPYSTVNGNCLIGNDTVIEGYCEIGYPTPRAKGVPLVLGERAHIRSHSVFYEGSSFGEDLKTGHRVTVREGTQMGGGCQIGTLCDIQGNCKIGRYARFHSSVHIGQLTEIRDFVWIFPYVVITNDPHPPSEVLVGAKIGNYVAIAAMSVILPGVELGDGVLIGAHSLVNKNVPASMVAVGSPAKVICDSSAIILRDGTGRPAYPWTTHFHRGYPEEIVRVWLDEISTHSKQG